MGMFLGTEDTINHMHSLSHGTQTILMLLCTVPLFHVFPKYNSPKLISLLICSYTDEYMCAEITIEQSN